MQITSKQKVIHFPSIHLTHIEAQDLVSELEGIKMLDGYTIMEFGHVHDLYNSLRIHLKGLS